MTISKNTDGSSLTVKIEGRLDTITAPQAEEELRNSLDGISDLTIDFAGLEYISSAGLRVLLSVHKVMKKQGSMKILNVNDDVNDIFELTGFCDIFTIVKV